MITKNDCVLLLTELQDSGVDVREQLKQLLSKRDQPTLELLKFINDHKQLDVIAFYEKLRKSYNDKKSKLYIQIVKEELNNSKDVIATLSSLCLQISLFSKTLDNPVIFFENCRLKEITACLYNYSKTYDLIPCQKLLELIRSDLKVLESIHREKDNLN